MTVSIIIPILNEADNLPLLFGNIASLDPLPTQVIVVDGGSTDDSVAIIKKRITSFQSSSTSIDWILTESAAGRATQMNSGATLSTGDVLLFLHADTQLPIDAIDKIIRAMSQAKWGRFNVRLDSRQPILWLVSQMINLRSRLSRIATGDQAIFIDHALFKRLGGYSNQSLMEDVELCKRLRGIAKPACLSDKVITSARRWQQYGSWRTIWLMWHLRFDYWRGVSADNIRARYYRNK